MPGDGRRVRRVAEMVRVALGSAFATTLGDPLLARVVITDVTMTNDLGQARVMLRLLTERGERDRQEVIQHLSRAAGRLRRLLAPHLDLRRVPELRFVYDTGMDAQARVEALLHEIETERTPD